MRVLPILRKEKAMKPAFDLVAENARLHRELNNRALGWNLLMVAILAFGLLAARNGW